MDQIGAMLGRQQIWRTWNYPFLFCHKQINVKKEWCYGDNGIVVSWSNKVPVSAVVTNVSVAL